MKLCLLPFLVVVFLADQASEAWPTGAGACTGGGKAATDGVPGHTRDTTTTGELLEGEYAVKIGGKELSPVGQQRTKIPIGEEVPIELMSTGAASFKGFLLRLSTPNAAAAAAVSDALMVPRGETDIQVSDLCTEAGVSGLTHTANDDKTSVKGSIMIADSNNNVPLSLDVTVVRSNGGVLSEYYYEGYSLMTTSQGTNAAAAADASGNNNDNNAQLDRIENKLDRLLSQACDTSVTKLSPPADP